MLEMASCSVCQDAGYYRKDVPVDHPDFGRLIRCDCKRADDADRLQRLSGLTDSERSIRLGDIVTDGREGTQTMVRACTEFLSEPTGILTLWGGVGNAKTMALQAIVNEMLSRGIGAVYITAFDLFAYVRAAFNAQRDVLDGDAYERLVRFERVRILALDEFDKVRVSDWVLEQITDLIDKRYRLGLDGQAGTVIASNSDPANLPDWIASRLLDGRNRVIHNADRDIRSVLKG